MYRDREIVLIFLRIGEDVVGGFLYPGLVLQGVHLLNIHNIPLLFGLQCSSSPTEGDTDPSNLHADIGTSFTDCGLFRLSNTKYELRSSRSEGCSHLVVNHFVRDNPHINVVLPVVDDTNVRHLATLVVFCNIKSLEHFLFINLDYLV